MTQHKFTKPEPVANNAYLCSNGMTPLQAYSHAKKEGMPSPENLLNLAQSAINYVLSQGESEEVNPRQYEPMLKAARSILSENDDLPSGLERKISRKENELTMRFLP